MTSPIVTSHFELDRLLDGRTSLGLVPTMGALHAGHLDLIARSARENAETVVSVFVNPAQFSSRADLDHYPRDIAADAALASGAGATLIFAPTIDEIYPPGFDTWVEPGSLSHRWEGASRPGHFRGVCTVVAKLLNLVRPARSYFGEKDYQQLQVVRRMHEDLALPGQIVSCPTVRDSGGLALSSRNARLDADARELALAIPRAMEAVKGAVDNGERQVDRLVRLGLGILDRPGIDVDYLAIVDPATLEPKESLDNEGRLLIAATVSGVRLIDNSAIGPVGTPKSSGVKQMEPASCQ